MARKVKTVVELTDDIDGGKADQTVSFGFDGVTYEIDLSKKNTTAFQKALKPYLEAARKVRAHLRPHVRPWWAASRAGRSRCHS